MGEGKGKTWRWDFDGDTVGVTPHEFEVILGDWVVCADTTSPSAPNVLAQIATFTEGIHFPRCLVKDLHLEDLRMSVKFKPISGECDQGGGLVFRFQDPQNFYVPVNAPHEIINTGKANMIVVLVQTPLPCEHVYVRQEEMGEMSESG